MNQEEKKRSTTATEVLPRYLPFTFPGVPNVRCLFTTALAGTFSVTGQTEEESRTTAENKISLMKACKLDGWAEVHQVHKDDFIEGQKAPLESLSQYPSQTADGHYTEQKRLGLVIKTADCQPILFTHKNGQAIGAIHAGWRGNAQDYPVTAIRKFCEIYKFAPADLVAVRGPSLGPTAAEFINFDKEWPAKFRPWYNRETQKMNLWQLTKDQLVAAGLLLENVFSLDYCTYSMPDLFYSYRQKHTGRHANIIWRV